MADKEKEIEAEEDKLAEEEFASGMTDTELLAQINAWEQESDTVYGLLKRVWDENLNYYHGIQTGVEKIYGKNSKAVENRIWMATETMIPIVTARLPEIVVQSLNPDEQSQMDAQDTQDVIGFEMERNGMQEKSERFVRDMIIKRYGVFKMPWNKEENDVGLQVIDPRRIRIPRYGKCLYDCAFLLEDLELSYEQAESFFGKDKAEELKKQNPEKDSENKKRKKTFSVVEVWTNDFVAWKAGNLILDSKKNPYWDWENEKNNFLDAPRKPYVVKSIFETEESIIGDTDYIQQTKSVQDNINIRKRQIENITSKVANPIMLIDSDVMSEEQAGAITNEEGLILYGKDAANGSKVRFEAPGNVPAYLFNDLQLSRTEFDNIWGIHSTTRGERQGRETASGRQLLKQADLGRIDLLGRQVERAMDEIAEFWVQLMKLFYTEDRIVSILGEEGVRFINNFNNSKIGNIRLVVKPGSTLPRDEVTIHDEALQLWQMKAIGVKTLYKMLRLPNMQEAMADFVETQSGAILQPAQPAAAPVAPAQIPPMGA